MIALTAMTSNMKHTCMIISFFLLLHFWVPPCTAEVHIVYFGEHEPGKTLQEIEDHHLSYLISVKKDEAEARSSLLYSYKNSINGFAAVLTAEEASKLRELEEVVSVFESQIHKLHTTRSWDFVGLGDIENALLAKRSPFNVGASTEGKNSMANDVIIGVIDSGVWPESNSFRDLYMGPIPSSWKGTCQIGHRNSSKPFFCNKKIIGARYYMEGYKQLRKQISKAETLSPRDVDGHGTHTASIAAGRRVPCAASFRGFAAGTASGGAPLARLAIYKACWGMPDKLNGEETVCLSEDMLAAFDDAVGDGVHVLSVSVGNDRTLPFHENGISIGALHAVKKDIVVAMSAGNSGPSPGSVSNTAPWMFTVGASSIDRTFVEPVLLGNGVQFEGQSISPYAMKKMYPLVYAGDVADHGVSRDAAGLCHAGSLSPKHVKGKIVLCIGGHANRVEQGREVKRAGGIGMILGNDEAQGNQINCDLHVLPAASVVASDANDILKYIRSDSKPKARLLLPRTYLNVQAPVMADFSSQGPSLLDPHILKPDITAPGVDILAAWSTASPPTKLEDDDRSVKYNIYSGTSMSCPHVAAAAALLRAVHPTWSSAAIRSALMTTALRTDNENQPIRDTAGNSATPFQLGSGHFSPLKAADPGLVYDATYKDYLLYLCSRGQSGLDKHFKCPKEPPSAVDLNYPSIAIPDLSDCVTITRTVTYVGDPGNINYYFTAEPPYGISIETSVSSYWFQEPGQKLTFTITVTATESGLREYYNNGYAFGWYSWTDGQHEVRSPVAVSFAY